jgi:hypothetical protein
MFFFFSFYFPELYEALKTDESFMDLLRRGTHSTKGKRRSLEIRRLDKEVAKDLRHWMRSPATKSKGLYSDEPM